MMTYQSDTRYCIKTIEPPYTERYVRWCERTMGEIITHFLLDFMVNKVQCLTGLESTVRAQAGFRHTKWFMQSA